MYETLKQAEENGILPKLIKSGIVPITLAGQKMIYEVYLEKKARGIKEGYGKSQAVLRASIDTNTEARTIWRIIKKMES